MANAPALGIYPRGLFMQPAAADVEDVTAVVLSQNPGAADLFERWAHRLVSRISTASQFDELWDLLGESAAEIGHYAKIQSLLRLLWADAADRSFLFAEVVYCQDASSSRKPNDKTYVHCAQQHLEPQLAEVPDNTLVLCLGDRAAAWFASYPNRERFRWLQLEHPSGKNRHWKKLFVNGDLSAHARAAWTSFLAGQRPTGNGMRLSGDPSARPMRRP